MLRLGCVTTVGQQSLPYHLVFLQFLTRAELKEQVASQKPQNVNTAITRLIKSKDIRPVVGDAVVLTPNGQKRILEQVMPKLAPQQ